MKKYRIGWAETHYFQSTISATDEEHALDNIGTSECQDKIICVDSDYVDGSAEVIEEIENTKEVSA